MKKYSKIIVVSLIIILLLILGILLFRPISYQAETTVCSLSGQALPVEFDITLHKYPLGSNKITGQIILNGKEYISVSDLYPNHQISSYVFHIPTGNAIENWENTIILDLYKNSFDYYVLYVMEPDNSCAYYGPASSLQEVEEILSHFQN